MNKRILSMLLALCMVLVAVPVFALTVLAADDAVTHTVTFRLPDGTVVVSREVEEGPTTIGLPTEEETNAVLDTYNEKVDAAYRLTYSDILGYYEITPSGEYKSAKAYETFLLEDKEFYAITDKSVFNRSINWPLYTSKTSFDGYRGSWTLASYRGASDEFVTFYNMDKTHDIINTGDTWANGGLYLGNDPHLVTTTAASAALVWRALAPGKVNVDMNYIGFTSTNGAGSVSDIAMAIAKNGTIVWPASAAGKTMAETWSTAGSGETNTWYFDKITTQTGSMKDGYTAYCDKNGYPQGIEVEAGDELQLVFKKVSTPLFTCYPIVSYEDGTRGEVDNAAADVAETLVGNIYTSAYKFSYPTVSMVEGKLAVTDDGWKNGWTWVYYGTRGLSDYSNGKIANVQGSSAEFITAAEAAGSGQDFHAQGRPNGAWNDDGNRYGAMAPNKDIVVGHRYTAQYSGTIDVSLDTLFVYAAGTGKFAIYCNGEKIWPTDSDWYELAKNGANNVAATANATMGAATKNISVLSGDVIDFLATSDVDANDWNNRLRGAVMEGKVTYTSVFDDVKCKTLTGTAKENGKYDVTMTLRGTADEIRVRGGYGVDGQITTTEMTPNAAGAYVLSDLTVEQYETRMACFEVSFRVGERWSTPVIYKHTVPAYMDAYYTKIGGCTFANASVDFTTTDGNAVPKSARGWDLVIYDDLSEIGDPANGHTDLYRWKSSAGDLSAANTNASGTNINNETAFFVVAGGNDTAWRNYYAPYVVKNRVAGYRYTVPESGFAYLSATKVGRASAWNGDYNANATKLAVTLNGRQIWPTDGTWYPIPGAGDLTADVKASIEAALSNVYVEKGDIIEYLVTSTNLSIYSSAATFFYGDVKLYKDTPETVITPSSLKEYAPRMDGTFGVRLTLGAADENVIDYETVATIGGRALTATYDKASNSILLSGILATEMMQPLTYRVYAVSEHTGTDNVTVKHYHPTAAAETTYAAMIAAYLDSDDVTVRDMAVAILNYGAAAQQRFLETPGELPTTKLNGKTLSFETPTAEDKYAQADREGKAYAFSGATLLLQDRIRLKLYIDLQTGADMLDGDLYLEYGTDAGFAGAEKALLLQRGNEGDDKSNAHLKATLDILPTAFAATMYFRVVTAEGTVVSSTLTYSVSSYAARSTEDAALTAAILALGKAAENYGG